MASTEPQPDDEDIGGDALPVGAVLLRGSYRLTRFIASGGFGMTYLATDNLDRTVVIKECFPSSICFRQGVQVVPLSRASAGEFETLVDLFKTEARNLSRLSHPNIVKVHQVFDDNNTAYMVLDYVAGRDLASKLDRKKKPLPPETVTAIADKLVDAVATIHAANVLHRDISPDNILLTDENEPVLIDFGAARQVAINTSRKLSAMRMVKDGYSPQEFYSTSDEMHFSSDLYSLAASLHHAIVGYPPPNAQERVLAVGSGADDPYRPIALQARGYERGLLNAIDRALGLFPIDRPNSAKEWRQLQKGQRIPNRSGRRKADPSHDLIRELIEGADAAPPEPEVDEVLRGLRAHEEPRRRASRGRSPKLYASLTLLAGLAAASIYLHATPSKPLLSFDLSRIGLTSAAPAAPNGALAFSDGTTFSLYRQDGRPVTWVSSTGTGSQGILRRGDVIVSLLPDRAPVTGPDMLNTRILEARRLGRSSVTFAIWRDGKTVTLPFDISNSKIVSSP